MHPSLPTISGTQLETDGARAGSPGGWAPVDNGAENKLGGLLASLLTGGVRGGGVPSPGQELVASGLRFMRPVDEHMGLNDVRVTPLLVRSVQRFVVNVVGCAARLVVVSLVSCA